MNYKQVENSAAKSKFNVSTESTDESDREEISSELMNSKQVKNLNLQS